MKKKILWLTSWYPNRTNLYTGDFIERHARAAMLNNNIDVVHVLRDRTSSSVSKNIEKFQYTEGGSATIIYYHSASFFLSWFDKLYSNLRYLKIHHNFLKDYIKSNGKPAVIHVHTGLKAGLPALLFKFLYRIPYVVTEHWSGFCTGAIPGFNDKSFLFRWLWRKVLKNALALSAVSENLAADLKQKFNFKKIWIIPNVVDSRTFFPGELEQTIPNFIHISNLNYQKNPEQILEAAAILNKRSIRFNLNIVGEPNEDFKTMVAEMNLAQIVTFTGLCPQEKIRILMQRCKALILYSRYETFGCVIIEANACGIPVIVSDIPVFHENVREGLTGIFVPLNDPSSLASSMQDIIEDKLNFDKVRINKWVVDRYSFKKISEFFKDFYFQHGF